MRQDRKAHAVGIKAWFEKESSDRSEHSKRAAYPSARQRVKMPTAFAATTRWCNGNTGDFGSPILGSSPSRVALDSRGRLCARVARHSIHHLTARSRLACK